MIYRIATIRFSAILFLAIFSDAAVAEMYRCVSADGSVAFSDNAAACPGAQKHETTDRLQTVTSRTSAPERPPAAPENSPGRDPQRTLDDERAQKRIWQQKKHAAEQELQSLVEKQARLGRVVTGCNRGAEIITRDSTGIKYKVSCDEIRREHAESEEQSARLQQYLKNGLRKECRQAGCLPGWIR